MPNLSDPRLADYANLRDVELRKSLEAEHGLFIAEGEKVIRRAVAAGYPVRSVLLAPRWAEPLADLLDQLGDRVHVVDDAVVEDDHRVPGSPRRAGRDGTAAPAHGGTGADRSRRPVPGVQALDDPAGRGAPSQPIPAVKDPHDHGHGPNHEQGHDHKHGDDHEPR